MAIITIGGNIGAGKTTLAAKLAKALDYDELYMGHIFRMMAREQGLSIEEFYANLASDPATEEAIDKQQEEFMKTNDDIVVQGRIAWFFAKTSPFVSFNIFLTVDPVVGAERTSQRPENAGRSIDVMARENEKREQTEKERYEKLYDIDDFTLPSHYDFVLDTTNLSLDQAFEKVYTKIKERLDSDV